MCTGILMKSIEDKVYWGRTQEFDMDLQYQGIIIPRNYTIKDTLHSFETKYSAVGISANNLSTLADGLNEKGIAGGSFYFADYNKYSEEKDILKNNKLPVRGQDVVLWVLTNCATLEEIKERINKEIAVANVDFSFPQHYVFQNEKGESLVVEPSIEGEFKMFDNPVGIFTNSPPFDWHLINLQNYINLTNHSVDSVELNRKKIFSPGKGSGLLGLPGDITAPSRFVRATTWKFLSDKVNDNEMINHLFHIFNNFDIPKGVVRSSGELGSETTHYTVIYDLENRKVYLHNYHNRQIQTFELFQELQDKNKITRFEISQTENYLKMEKIIEN